jgi:pimeloyl-ACP methyl ester carboxylesterase
MPTPYIDESAPRRSLRTAGKCLLAALIGMQVMPAVAADLVPIEPVGSEYVKPQQRIDVGGGRRMNLHCMGTGSPTVVFESGLSDWSNTWALIQPAIAKSTRACAYDRPGMGYSDPAAGPRTPDAAIQDLKRLLDGAGIKEKVVLVGHSLGGFYAKLFAVTYPERVAGLVLVDPSEERLWQRLGPMLSERFGPALVRTASDEVDEGIGALMAHFEKCAAEARSGGLGEERYKKCTDPVRAPLGSAILAERRVLQALPTYQDTQSRELNDSMYGKHPEADARYARLFAGTNPLGDLPLIVLTHSLWDMSDATSEVHYHAWRQAHVQTAALSRRGAQEMVPNSKHNMQVDNPGAVVDAIERLLKMVPARQTP